MQLSDYRDDWPDLFEREKSVFLERLGSWLHGPIEHVGSTAVPGLKAKPIIDIMVGVKDLDSSVGAIDVLQRIGHTICTWFRTTAHSGENESSFEISFAAMGRSQRNMSS